MGISLIGTLAQIRRFCNVTDLETWVTKKIHKKITNRQILTSFPSLGTQVITLTARKFSSHFS